MSELISFFSEIIKIFGIVGFITLGFSIAVKVYAILTAKKIQKASDVNYLSIDVEKRVFCDEAIEKSKTDINLYFKQSEELKKIKIRNKLRRFFKLKLIEEPIVSINLKKVCLDMVKNLAAVFYGEDAEKVFLKFSEKEIFYILNTLKNRMLAIIDSTDIIWLKQIKIATVLQIFDVYNNFSKSKIGVTVFIVKGVVDVCLKISSLISPVSISKRFLNGISSKNLKDMVADTVFTVAGKELAVIYKDKQLLSEK